MSVLIDATIFIDQIHIHNLSFTYPLLPCKEMIGPHIHREKLWGCESYLMRILTNTQQPCPFLAERPQLPSKPAPPGCFPSEINSLFMFIV